MLLILQALINHLEAEVTLLKPNFHKSSIFLIKTTTIAQIICNLRVSILH